MLCSGGNDQENRRPWRGQPPDDPESTARAPRAGSRQEVRRGRQQDWGRGPAPAQRLEGSPSLTVRGAVGLQQYLQKEEGFCLPTKENQEPSGPPSPGQCGGQAALVCARVFLTGLCQDSPGSWARELEGILGSSTSGWFQQETRPVVCPFFPPLLS